MSPNAITALGVLGNVLLVAAYLPQIRKIILTKKAEDLSMGMWGLYVLGDLLLLVYAALTGDTIFTALFTLFTIENVVIFYLTLKYAKAKPQ